MLTIEASVKYSHGGRRATIELLDAVIVDGETGESFTCCGSITPEQAEDTSSTLVLGINARSSFGPDVDSLCVACLEDSRQAARRRQRLEELEGTTDSEAVD